MRGYLYIIADPLDSSWLKVGVTIDLSKRLFGYNSSFSNYPASYLYTSIKLENAAGLERILIDEIRRIKYIQNRKQEWFKIPVKSSNRVKSVLKARENKAMLKLKHKIINLINDYEDSFGIFE